jgi:hypothetical protein
LFDVLNAEDVIMHGYYSAFGEITNGNVGQIQIKFQCRRMSKLIFTQQKISIGLGVVITTFLSMGVLLKTPKRVVCRFE